MLDVPITKIETIDSLETGWSVTKECEAALYSVRLVLDFSPHDWLKFSSSKVYQELEAMLGHKKKTCERCGGLYD